MLPDRGERVAVRCFAECLAAVLTLTSLLALAAIPAVPTWRAVPSPWVVVGCGAPLASLWMVHRSRRRDTLAALRVGARAPARLAVFTFGVALCMSCVAGLVGGGRAPRVAVATSNAAVAVDGSLLGAAAADGHRWWWPRWSPVPERVSGPPASFRPVPRSVGRYRLRLLLARAPWRPTEHPLDPSGSRWLAFLLGPLLAGALVFRRVR